MPDPHPFRAALPADRVETAFEDAKPTYTDAEAEIEANRCLFCYDAPCITACPTGIDIPGFIKKIASGNIDGSARTILTANMLGYSCARVCPVEVLCVGDCVYNHLNGDPIQIGKLQRYATEQALRKERESGRKLFVPAGDTGKRVALIGAGPASLACAAHLALAGVKPVLFEKGSLPGGLNTTGVAPYKLQSEHALDEVEWLLGHGIELREGVSVGEDVTVDSLLEDYDAIFLGVGIGRDSTLGLPGSDGPGVWGATDLIARLKNEAGFAIPDTVSRVIVIGGGNTAIDIARELAMLGIAEVSMLYRRSEQEMSGYAHEMDGARKHDVRLLERLQPTEVLRENGAVSGLRAKSTVDGSVSDYVCDWIVEAVGQAKHVEIFRDHVALDQSGCVMVESETCRTKHPMIYAGGDCINGGKEVVNAAQDGKIAARSMMAAWGM